MYHIYLDERTGIAKVIQENDNGLKVHATFATVQDVCNAFSANARVETPIIPPSCFKYVSSQDGITAFLFYPGRQLDFQIYDRGGVIKKYNLRIPNTVIQAFLSVPQDNGATMLHTAKIFFTDALLPIEGMKMYKPPFPNVYEDNKICFGAVQRGGYNVNNLFGLDAIFGMFFNNVANWDLWRGETIDGKRYTSPIDFMEDLIKLTPEDMHKKAFFTSDKFKTLFSSHIA